MGTATVLVVDDERKIRDTVRAFLEQQRYAVLVAGSGQEALDVAGRLKPDLVVLDLMLPDLAGEEVARSLRAISQVPIIMLTAKASEAERVARLRLGADCWPRWRPPRGGCSPGMSWWPGSMATTMRGMSGPLMCM
jgi:DNA-binding response OmpR family regulator